jgi:hypothetical protein
MTIVFATPTPPTSSATAPRRLAADAPSTTAGYRAVAALSHVPLATPAPTVPSRSVRAASTERLPVSAGGMWSLRYTEDELSIAVAVTEVTGPIRPIIATASSGRCDGSPWMVCPGATRNRFVPSVASCRLRLARLESAMPTTQTIAAMPIAMPKADRNTRSGRVRSPAAPTRTASRGSRRDGTVM